MGFFGNFGDIASAAKDAAKDFAVQAFAPKLSKMLIERYQLDKIGKLSGVKINRKQLEIEFSLDLRGEENPIDVKVQFRTLPPNEIEISNVTASREWIAILINELLPVEKKRFEVSAEVVSLLS
jgi:hypothetical protein